MEKELFLKMKNKTPARLSSVHDSVCLCVCARARACVCVCARVCARVCVCFQMTSSCTLFPAVTGLSLLIESLSQSVRAVYVL